MKAKRHRLPKVRLKRRTKSVIENRGLGSMTVKSALAVARHFHVAERTVRRWLAEGCPRTKGGRYDLKRIEQWLMLRQQYKPSEEERHWAARWKAAKAKLAELEYKSRRGELVEKDLSERIWERHIVQARSLLLALSERLCVLLPAELRVAMRPEVRKAVDEVLLTLAMSEEAEVGKGGIS